MIVTCPSCETVFSLPDESYVAGKKARCSQCGNVFTLPEQSNVVEDGDFLEQDTDTTRPRKGGFFRLLLMLLLLAGLCYGGFYLYQAYGHLVLSPPSETVSPEDKKQLEELAESVSKIQLEGVLQFVVNNDKLGDVVVIQGRAVNGFDTPKEFISVEVRIFDEENKLLASKTQLAGATLSQFQLQVLGESELRDALNNKIDILTNNVNIAPGGKVPFVVIFAPIPEGFAEFEVRPVTAKDPVQEAQ